MDRVDRGLVDLDARLIRQRIGEQLEGILRQCLLCADRDRLAQRDRILAFGFGGKDCVKPQQAREAITLHQLQIALLPLHPTSTYMNS